MTKRYNPITNQWEDDNISAPAKNPSNKRRYNPITNQWEDDYTYMQDTPQLDKTESVIGGFQKPNIFKQATTPMQGIGTMQTPSIAEPYKYSVWDALAAGNFGSAKFADTLIKTADPVKAFVDAGNEVGKALNSAYRASIFGPEDLEQPDAPERVTYSDVIKNNFPEFAKNYPITAGILGFVGDVALDPTTYVSFGAETGARIAGRQLSNKGIDLIRNLNTLSEDAFKYTIRNAKTGLERTGYIGVDELQRLSNIKRLTELSQGAIDGDAAALGQLNTIINAQTKGFKGKLISVEALTPAERSWSVESNFIGLARSDTSLVSQSEGVGLYFNIPFSPKRITVVPAETVDKLIDYIPGIRQLTSNIRENLKEFTPIYSLSRSFPLENFDQYNKLAQDLWGAYNVTEHYIASAIKDVADLPETSRKTLADISIRLDQKIADKQSLIKYSNDQNKALPIKDWMAQNPTKNLTDYQNYVDNLPAPQILTQQSIDKTRQFWLNKALKDGDITTEEFATYTKFLDSQNKLADLDIMSKTAKQVNDSGILFSPQAIGRSNYLHLVEQQSKGEDLDLAVLYALKLKTLGYKQAINDFDEGLKIAFGKINPTTGAFELAREDLPKAIQRDLDYIGTSFYSDKLNKMKDPWFTRQLGNFNNVWKVLAYPFRPYAWFKQGIANPIQASTQIGTKALKMYDPRTIFDVMTIMLDGASFRNIIPTKLVDTVRTFGTPTGKMIYAVDKFQPDLASGLNFVSRLNEHIPGPQMTKELMEQDVYHKGLNILSLEHENNLKLQIAKANGFWEFQKEKWHQGYWTTIKNTVPWINFPGYIENIQRIGMYVSARKLGMDAESAGAAVKKALFDYHHSTTPFEDIWMKRLVPFYTFNRFAIPLIGSLLKNPGKAAVVQKTARDFFEVWQDWNDGKELTDTQKAVLPGYLISQPSVYDGISQEGGVKKGIFRTFNSYLFTDVTSFLQFNPNGTLDTGKTLRKLALGQLTAALKVPLEYLMDKNFFTDIPISKGGKIESGDAVGFYDKWLPEQVKSVIDYEVRTDPVTGQKRGYINPTLAHFMSGWMPFINDYINITKDDLTPQEFGLKFITGIGTNKIDFEQEKNARIKDLQQQYREIQKQIFQLNLQTNDIADQRKLQNLIKKMNEKQVESDALAQKINEFTNVQF